MMLRLHLSNPFMEKKEKKRKEEEVEKTGW